MITGRLDALDIFRLWMAERCVIRVQGSFALFAFSSDGRISSVTEQELRIQSDDARSELVLRLTNDLTFHYADNRNITGEERRYGECIIVRIGLIPENGEPDTIALGALKPV